MQNRIDTDRLAASPLIQQLVFREQAASTNDLAVQQVAAGELHPPALVVASRQTAGRGRGANRWWTGPGALAFSYVIDPDTHGLQRSSWPAVSLATAVAVCETVDQHLGQSVSHVKWPNDVLLGSLKAAGILVESPPARDDRPALVIGVGLNVNNSLSAAPQELQQTAMSLVDWSARTFSLTTVLEDLIQHIDAKVTQLALGEDVLIERWQALSYLTGRDVALQVGTRQLRGRCLGIDRRGALMLRTPEALERLFSGIVVDYR